MQRCLPVLAHPSKRSPSAPRIAAKGAFGVKNYLPKARAAAAPPTLNNALALSCSDICISLEPSPPGSILGNTITSKRHQTKGMRPSTYPQRPVLPVEQKSSTTTPRAAVSERSEPPNRTCPSRAATTCVHRKRPEDRPTSAKLDAVFCPHTVLRKAHLSLKEVTCIFRLFDYAPTPCTLSIASTFDATNVFAKCSTNDDPSSKP